MTLAEIRADLTDEILQRAEALRWPKVIWSDAGLDSRRGYCQGDDAWRIVPLSMTLAELRQLRRWLMEEVP
ncbi:MAG: hypothetical protein ACHQ01_09630 [Candidatus Limnocylindrales bacterium]